MADRGGRQLSVFESVVEQSGCNLPIVATAFLDHLGNGLRMFYVWNAGVLTNLTFMRLGCQLQGVSDCFTHAIRTPRQNTRVSFRGLGV